MDLLDYGMRNQKSESAVKRLLAQGALAAARKQADLYEARLMKKSMTIPENPEEDAAMLERIRQELSNQK